MNGRHMKSASKLSLILVLFAAALVAMPVTAGDRPKFFGNYEGKAFDGENKMLWILGRRQDGSTTVNIVIRPVVTPKVKGKAKVVNLGQADGVNVKVQGD